MRSEKRGMSSRKRGANSLLESISIEAQPRTGCSLIDKTQKRVCSIRHPILITAKERLTYQNLLPKLPKFVTKICLDFWDTMQIIYRAFLGKGGIHDEVERSTQS